MSGGYTPVFRSIFQGTLCGKYPELPVWLVLLALADRHGEIDAHPSYIATVSGLPQADIEAAIRSFCKADEASRSPDEDGRRLIPIPGRGFGWTIVNHGKYREKARLAAKSEREIASGKNASRMADRRRPPETAANRPSDANTNKDKEEEKRGADAPPPVEFHPQLVPGLDVLAWGAWVAHRKAIRKPIRPHSMPAAAKQLAALGKDQMREVERAIAGGWQGLHPDDRKGNGKPRPTRYDELMEQARSGPPAEITNPLLVQHNPFAVKQ